MTPKTILVVPGKKIVVPKMLKRAIQIALGSAVTALVALTAILANGMLVGKGTPLQAWNIWIAFVRRPDISMTALLTAGVTVAVVYWMRGYEKS